MEVGQVGLFSDLFFGALLGVGGFAGLNYLQGSDVPPPPAPRVLLAPGAPLPATLPGDPVWNFEPDPVVVKDYVPGRDLPNVAIARAQPQPQPVQQVAQPQPPQQVAYAQPQPVQQVAYAQPTQGTSLDGWEQAARQHNDREYGAFFGHNGEFLGEITGQSDTVPLGQWRGRSQGLIFSHNHPDRQYGNSFSEGDWGTAAQQQFAELRGVDARYRYTLRPPAGGWNMQWWRRSGEPAFQQAMADQMPVIDARQAELRAQGYADDQVIGISNSEYWDSVNRQAAAATGAQYYREEF